MSNNNPFWNSTIYKLPEIYEVPEKMLKSEIEILIRCGFFKNFQIDDAVSIAVGRAIIEVPGYEYWNYDKNYVDKIELMRLDTKKTWIRSDLEFIYNGGNEYIQVLCEISKISEQNFSPINICEIWKESNIELQFENNKIKHKIELKIDKDWADLESLIKGINEIITETNYQFYFGPSLDTQIIGLNSSEFLELSKIHKLRKP